MLLNTPACQIGQKAPSFTLSDPDNTGYSLEELMGEKGLAIAFICNDSLYIRAVIDRFVADAKLLQADGVNVVAIMSNDYRYVSADSPPNMKKFAQQHGFIFPYLVDEDQSVGQAYGAVCTPDFFGFNDRGEMQYRGRLDDARMGDPTNRKPELLEAMRLVAVTGAGPDVQLPSMGCSIKWS